MSNLIEVKAKVSKQLYYNQDKMWGVYSFILEEADSEIKLDQTWGTFVVSGNCPMLVEKKTYEFTIEPSWSKKYGDGYQFVQVKERKLMTVEEQQEYLRQIISLQDANTLINAYPDVMIVDYIKENKIDVNKLKGIKEHKLNKIKEKLTSFEKLQVALVELKDLGITINAVQRLVNHFGTQEMLIHKVKENIYSLCEVDLFGFKRVDEYAMKRGDNPTSPFRIRACFEHIIKEYGNEGHSWIHKEELLKRAEDLLAIDAESIVNVLNQLQEENQKTFYISEEKVSLLQYYRYESEIKFHLDRLQQNYTQPEHIKSIEEVEEQLGITFTDEQRHVIQLAKQNGVLILNGKAGSGKTLTVKGIVESLGDIDYQAVALSGKAAKVLDSRGIHASTIHRLLGIDPGTGKFVHNFKNPLPYQTIILDEASMVNTQLFHSLVQAIPNGSQFIIVGDNGQLPPIGLGAVFDDLLNTNVYQRQELTKVHRQAEKSGILSNANKVRDGYKINGRYDYNKQVLGELQDMVLIPTKTRDRLFQYVLDIAEGYVQKYGESAFTDFQILTPLKNRGEISVKKLNMELQKIFIDTKTDYVERNGYQFRKGDKIIHSGNNYSAACYKDLNAYLQYSWYEPEELFDGDFLDMEEEVKVKTVSVFNGTIGRIVHLNKEKKEILIQFEDIDGLVAYSGEELGKIELAYAITIHRSQGIGVKNVLFVLDYSAYTLLSKQLIYTGMTRASEKLVLLCENGALHKAIETDLGSTRNTFLKELLKGG